VESKAFSTSLEAISRFLTSKHSGSSNKMVNAVTSCYTSSCVHVL